VGGITDVVVSMLLGIPFNIYVKASRGLPEGDLENRIALLNEAVHANVGLTIVQLVIGISCSILGGYVAATIAKQNEILNGVLASWLCLGIGIFALFSGHSAGALWLNILTLVVTPLAYFSGAHVWLRRNRPLLFAPDT